MFSYRGENTTKQGLNRRQYIMQRSFKVKKNFKQEKKNRPQLQIFQISASIYSSWNKCERTGGVQSVERGQNTYSHVQIAREQSVF